MNGLYGTVRPAVVSLDDIEIWYNYRQNRSESASEYTMLETGYLEPIYTDSSTSTNQINGLCNLRLPLDKFNDKGIYTIYIKPKEYEAQIYDIGRLAVDPSIVGVVFNKKDNTIPWNDLSGYRIEYYDEGKANGMARLITTSNYCEIIRIPAETTYASSSRYNLTSSSSSGLVFCTVTPSAVSSFDINGIPSIGKINQTVRIINTKFNPILMEVELVEHDADTITTLLEGDQIRDLDHGIITTYTGDKEIYRQHEYYTVKSQNGKPLYDVKIRRENVDTTQKYDNIID